MRVLIAMMFLTSLTLAQTPSSAIDPPPVDEAALAARLFDMTKPSSGERAILVHDPTYYPGITTRLREALHAHGVQTYVILEDTPAMVASYLNNDSVHDDRERDIVATWKPVFDRADIFYWMPTRGYGDDLRWEFLTAGSKARSVHFHWLLPFPGSRSAEEIVRESRLREERALKVDLAEHARQQQQLAAAMRGTIMRVTTPAGTDLSLRVRADEWFHFGNGDASKVRAGQARWLRDRQIELPVGMLQFVPDPETVTGTLVAPAIYQSGGLVRDVRLTIARGRVTGVSAATGAEWVMPHMRENGPDGDRIALVSFNTNPLSAPSGVGMDIGSNWENGATNDAVRMHRMSLQLADATVTVNNRVVIKDGRILWD